MKNATLAVCLAVGMLPACSSDDDASFQTTVDVAGSYTVNALYGENGCNFENWMTGNTLPGIPFVVQQSGAELTARVEGLVGVALTLVHGSNEYQGQLKGKSSSLELFGQVPQVQGNCTYTYNNVVAANFDGDFMTGQLSFKPAVTNNPDCATVTCESKMTLNGSRPPKE